MGKMFLTSSSIQSNFIWNFWSQLGPSFPQISLNNFKPIQINPKTHCASGRSTPSLLGPAHAHLHSPRAADRRTPPVSDAAARHYAGSLVSHLSPALFRPTCAHAAHVTRPCRAWAAVGTARRSGPGPTAPPRRVAPPTPGPPPFPPLFSPLSRCRRAARSLFALLRSTSRHTPLRPLLSSVPASPPLPVPRPPPPTTRGLLVLTDSGRAPPSSAPPR
jgi:hypothetical protein